MSENINEMTRHLKFRRLGHFIGQKIKQENLIKCIKIFELNQVFMHSFLS